MELGACANDLRYRQIKTLLGESLTTLGIASSDTLDVELDEWSALIFESYNNPNRVYHSVQHVLDVCEKLSKAFATEKSTRAIATLAGLFHDVIYLPLDKRLSEKQQRILHCDTETSEHKALVKEALSNDVTVASLVCTTFGIDRDGNFTAGGNEILSAIAAANVLRQYLKNAVLLRIIACIEASIPFRSAATDVCFSTAPMVNLHKNCHKANDVLSLGMSPQQLVEAIQTAAVFANSDLAAFCAESTLIFLDSTWSLLPEWSPGLLCTAVATLRTKHDAFTLLDQRYRGIVIDNIFHSFHNIPENISAMKSRARENIATVGIYAAARRVALDSLVKRMETLSPNYDIGAVPLIKTSGETSLLDLVDSVVAPVLTPVVDLHEAKNKEVYDFLAHSRRVSYSWDASASAYAAFFYDHCSPSDSTGSGACADIEANSPSLSAEIDSILKQEIDGE